MSDTARPKSGGDKLSAAEVNADLPVVVNVGETINGATLPVPVFMDDTDNEIKACDANDVTKLEFIGFAISNSTDGNPITLQKNGVVSGFSLLDIGKKYYVQDTIGTIGVNSGTYAVLVGVAISASEILIIQDKLMEVASASDNLKLSADTERGTTLTSYTKLKEIQVNHGGYYRVLFDMKTSESGYSATGRIYKNGVAYGTEHIYSATTNWQTYSEDLYFAPGDLIQIYAFGNGGRTASIKDNRINFDLLPYLNGKIITD